MENIKVCYHSYADDTQIYTTISPGEYNPIETLSPKYISDLLPHYEPSRPSRSSGTSLL